MALQDVLIHQLGELLHQPIFQVHLPREGLQHLHRRLGALWHVDVEECIEPPRPQQRAIHEIRPIRRSHDEDGALRLVRRIRARCRAVNLRQ